MKKSTKKALQKVQAMLNKKRKAENKLRKMRINQHDKFEEEVEMIEEKQKK